MVSFNDGIMRYSFTPDCNTLWHQYCRERLFTKSGTQKYYTPIPWIECTLFLFFFFFSSSSSSSWFSSSPLLLLLLLHTHGLSLQLLLCHPHNSLHSSVYYYLVHVFKISLYFSTLVVQEKGHSIYIINNCSLDPIFNVSELSPACDSSLVISIWSALGILTYNFVH